MSSQKLICVYIIRYSDGSLACCSKSYEAAARMAEEHVKGTDLTYVIN